MFVDFESIDKLGRLSYSSVRVFDAYSYRSLNVIEPL